MSVYQYDAIRTDEQTAKNILLEFTKPEYPKSWTGDDLLCLARAKDGSIIIEWETYHGSPWVEIQTPETPLLYIYVNNDLEAGVEKYNNVPHSWMKDFEIISDDGAESIDWKTFGETLDMQKFLGLKVFVDDEED